MSLTTSFRQKLFDVFRLTYFFGISYIRSRFEFPTILNRQGLKGKGVEVGVWKGEFSLFLLKHWKGEVLYSVDPWKTFGSDEYIDDMNINQQQFDQIHNDVANLLKPFGNRSKIIRKTSLDASLDFEDNSLDFVYLDGRHNYEGVKEDIELWFGKVKKGGILAGHDYLDGQIGSTDFGVKQAVDEFVKTSNPGKLLVTAKDNYPSWFLIK
jgi:hypothetical protein